MSHLHGLELIDSTAASIGGPTDKKPYRQILRLLVVLKQFQLQRSTKTLLPNRALRKTTYILDSVGIINTSNNHLCVQ